MTGKWAFSTGTCLLVPMFSDYSVGTAAYICGERFVFVPPGLFCDGEVGGGAGCRGAPQPGQGGRGGGEFLCFHAIELGA